MRSLLIILLIFFILTNINGQQDYQVSQFMYDQISINPGSAGNKDMACVSGILRNQWTGIEGAPEDIILNGSVPFKLFKKDHGIGLSIYREKIGFYEDIALKVAYAYRANVGDGKLGIGVGVNIQNRGLNPTWEIPEGSDLFTDVEQDNAIPSENEEKVFAIDVSAGIFYRTENLYLGISSTHLNEASFKYFKESINNDITKPIKRHYYITSGYTVQLSNPSFEIVPAVLIQSDGKIHKFDLNTVLIYNKKFWGGVTYRLGSSLTGMIGFEILNGARVGFAYDFPTTDLMKYYKTSYEVVVNYCFKIGVDKTPQKYKSIRFL